jgi:hypothetical protein
MLLASILAVALALSLVGTTYYFPSGQASQPAPQTTSIPVPYPSTAPVSSTASSMPALTATPMPTSAPSASVPSYAPVLTSTPVPASVTGESVNLIPVLSVVAAIVIAIVAVLLLFSERDIKSE